jgi:hypothetical protein
MVAVAGGCTKGEHGWALRLGLRLGLSQVQSRPGRASGLAGWWASASTCNNIGNDRWAVISDWQLLRRQYEPLIWSETRTAAPSGPAGAT